MLALEHDLRTVAGVDLAPIGATAYDTAHERTAAALEYQAAFDRASHALATH